MHTVKIYLRSFIAFLCLLAMAALVSGCRLPGLPEQTTAATTQLPTTVVTEPPHNWVSGYLAGAGEKIAFYGENGQAWGSLPRGTQVEYELTEDGATSLLVEESIVYLQEGDHVVSEPGDVVPEHTLYVRTAVNLRDIDGRLLETFAQKGTAVDITGCDYTDAEGKVHMYRVSLDGVEGYIMPWYLTATQDEALANYDNGHYATHADRGNRYGGGGAADLDYFPREKGPIEGNPMPTETRALYIGPGYIRNVDAYLAVAEGSGINAFVVDITDGGAVAYAGDVMRAYSPSAAAAAINTMEVYKANVQKLKDAGYYVIGRITTFNDTHFIKDHPEYAITDTSGNPLKLSGEYWPTPYNRVSWQYKVDMAVEAVEQIGFHEIQFDYVRFPDRTGKYEDAGTIDFHNLYGESKAQAIQRFLMYATDILHERGAYVSADVYGESAFTYVTAYGQYWPAISNVVDAISGMPYPDHFSASGSYRPWEHPYETLNNWGKSVVTRQAETATPAAVRTWIQAYNAIKEPYNTYGPDEVAAQIRGLRDAGCTGGYMTWNSACSLEKYAYLTPAFAPPEEGA